MKENGIFKRIQEMDKECKFGQMDLYMKGIGDKIKQLGMAD